MAKNNKDIQKVVLAYSGGLDTSVILKWLQDTYDCEVVTFTADLGQGEELEPAKEKARLMGIKEIFVEDLKEDKWLVQPFELSESVSIEDLKKKHQK